jgi:hypothetical protein
MRFASLSRAAIVLTLVACGGSEDAEDVTGAGTGTGSAAITATIDGVAWKSTSTAGGYAGTSLSFSGTDGTTVLAITVSPIAQRGTFSLSPDNSIGARGTLSMGAAGLWSSYQAGGSGTVTITTLTASRAAGTFAFDAMPSPLTPGEMRRVTNGRFDVAF